MVLKEENAMKRISAGLEWGKSKECLHKSEASCIILLKESTILKQNKRADSKSGISPTGRTYCSAKAGICKAFTDCTEVFPRQAREILLILSDDKHLLSFGKGL